MKDFEISHSTIHLEIGRGLATQEQSQWTQEPVSICKCLIAIQPLSPLDRIDIQLGGHYPKHQSKQARVRLVQLLTGVGSLAPNDPIDITNWTLLDNVLHVPLTSTQSSSKQFHVLIWWSIEGVGLQSFASLLGDSQPAVVPSAPQTVSESIATPTLLLSQDNMLDWFPCVLDDRYPMDFHISIPSLCPVTRRKLVVVCAGELVGRFSHPLSADRTIYKYSCKIPIAPKSVVITIGAFESVKFNLRSGMADGLFGDEVPDLLNSSVSSSRLKVFYQKEWDKDLIYSTCHYLPQALDFVEQWVGASFPFASLKLVFSSTCPVPIISGATVIIVNIQLLVSERDIDHWFGHYIARQSIDDVWLIVGFSRWIAYQFMRKIYGNNEVKYRLKKDMERLCLLDVKQPPICPIDMPKTQEDLLSGFDFNPFEDASSHRAELINLKSALILYMMEQRFGKGLLQKVASKIMMTQMSGELSSGLGTIFFLKLARKLSGKLEIKEFADQWIFRSGSPILTTTYSFNRKKMVIEVRIKQRSSNEGMVGANPKFT
ncbi:hypothetical protein HDU91_005325, partial [Kappamyces sp. JEL0680]